MPTWTAGIQIRKDASGNVHMNLGSSTPCWNDVIEGFRLNRPRPFVLYFQTRRRRT